MSGGIPMSPEEIARVNAYYGGAGISSPADAPPPAAPDPASYFGPPNTPPTAPGGIDPSWLQGAQVPSTALPPVEQSKPGALFGQAPPPALAPGTPTTPSGTAPSIASLKSASTQMNAEQAGAPAAPAASPESDKAARALAYYGGAGGPPKPAMRGGGGGSPSGPSEYKRAQADLLGTYDAEKKALKEGANAEQAKGEMIAAGQQDLAQQKQVQAQNAEMEAQDAAHHFQTYQEETQRQIDEVRQQKIQPNRAYSDSGSAVVAVLGGMLGGLYQGINHLQSNPFIDQMNRVIDRDIAAQETDLRTKKESIAERKGLLSEMRGIYKDDALAKAQAKNLYYEGAKEDLLAQAAQYDSPAIQARADQGVAAISRAQDGLKLQQLQQEAAARAAAAGAAERQRQQAFENALKLQESQNKTLTANAQAAKDFADGGKAGSSDVPRFVGTGKDAQGNPTGYLERNAEAAKERETATIAAQRLLKQIDRVQEIRREQGGAGRAGSELVHGIYDTKAANELAVLESDMTTNAAQAAHLGALSESDRGLMTAKFRNMNAVGSGPDERLDELRRITQAGLSAEQESAAGARATKVVGPDGREHIVVHGTQNAPNNQKVTPREKVGP